MSRVKQRRPKSKVRCQGIRQQRQSLRRNLRHIDTLWDGCPGNESPLSTPLLRKYWIIQPLYKQQEAMYRNNIKRCDDRIVSIHQPHVRPLVRGNVAKPVEFGAKLGVSLTAEGMACVDHISWDAYHEGQDLKPQVEAYQGRHGYYPEVVIADTLYGNRENRHCLKSNGIRYAGKPLGRPKKVTAENKDDLKALKKQRREEYCQRLPIEAKFGQGKNGYRLGSSRAKTKATGVA